MLVLMNHCNLLLEAVDLVEDRMMLVLVYHLELQIESKSDDASCMRLTVSSPETVTKRSSTYPAPQHGHHARPVLSSCNHLNRRIRAA